MILQLDFFVLMIFSLRKNDFAIVKINNGKIDVYGFEQNLYIKIFRSFDVCSINNAADFLELFAFHMFLSFEIQYLKRVHLISFSHNVIITQQQIDEHIKLHIH